MPKASNPEPGSAYAPIDGDLLYHTLSKSLWSFILTLDMYEALARFVFSTLDDQSRQLSAFQTPRVDTLTVFLNIETALRVMAIDDGRPLMLWDGGLMVVPELFAIPQC